MKRRLIGFEEEDAPSVGIVHLLKTLLFIGEVRKYDGAIVLSWTVIMAGS